MATDLLVKDAKKLLLLLFWSAFSFWLVLWIMLPTATGEKLVARAKQKTPSFVGDYGPILIVYSTPAILSSIFGLLLLHLKKVYPEQRSPSSRTRTEPRSNGPWKRFQNLMWTQPLVTGGPLGVATGFDILAITVVLAAVAWMLLKPLIPEMRLINNAAPPLGEVYKYKRRMGQTASAFARAALLPLTLLCIPVSRGSPMLRVVDIPFQHAVKYHRWLGHLTLTLLSAHSVLNIFVFVTEEDPFKLLKWTTTGVSYLAGIIAFAAGLLMWLTAIAPIRRRWFELFYAIHHLYLVLFTFIVFHVGPKMTSYTSGGVFLFFVDRFIRMVQSRHNLSLVATKVYPSGAMELKLRKAPGKACNLSKVPLYQITLHEKIECDSIDDRACICQAYFTKASHSPFQMSELVVHTGVAYTALSFVVINIPCVSRLEWHPFSVTSSPLENAPTLTICIKPLGKWTKKLHRTLVASDAGASTFSCPFSNLLFAEGPYGHASDFYLKYDALFLIAGGIGITPFIAILRDLFYRYQAKGRGLPVLPRSIQLIWTVKRGSELVLLTDIFPPKRFSNAIMHFECHAFITGRDNRHDTGEVSLKDGNDSKIEMTMNFPNASGREGSLSPVAATGNGLWVVSLVAVASCATILVMYVFDISTTAHEQSPISSQHIAWLYFGSIVVGISGFGGVVMVAWSLFRNTDHYGENFKTSVFASRDGTPATGFPLPDRENIWERNLLDNTNVLGGRPNFPKYFNAAAECYRGKEVGVLVCGPESLQRSVAAECKSHYMSSTSVSPFHFHSLSFDM